MDVAKRLVREGQALLEIALDKAVTEVWAARGTDRLTVEASDLAVKERLTRGETSSWPIRWG